MRRVVAWIVGAGLVVGGLFLPEVAGRSGFAVTVRASQPRPVARAAAAAAAAEPGYWARLYPGGRAPTALQWSTAAYDGDRHRMLMFGGTDQAVDYTELWALDLAKDQESWALLRPTGQAPYRRRQAASAYDTANQRLVLFGGYTEERGYFDETWFVDFAQGDGRWSKLAVSPRPPARRAATLVLQESEAVRRLILYGGVNLGGGLKDVWALNLDAGQERWQKLAPKGKAPLARDGHVAVYDALHDQMMVFGGWNRGATARTLNDVWTLSLTPGDEGWSEVKPSGSGPLPMGWMTGAYDPCPGHERLLVFGGYLGTRGMSSSDTWWLDLTRPGAEAWELIEPHGARPTPRDSNVMVYDPVARRLVIHGGWDGPGALMRDVWSLELEPCGTVPPATSPATDTPTATVTVGTPVPSPTASATQTNTPARPSPTATATGCPDAYEQDDAWYEAKPLPVDAPPQHRSLHAIGDVDYAQLAAEAGRRYVIRTLDLSPAMDTRLYLFDTDGTSRLAYNDDDPQNPPASRIAWTAPAAGTFFVRVTHMDPRAGACGLTYGLQAELATVSPPTEPPPLVVVAFLPIALRDATVAEAVATHITLRTR